MRWATRRHRHVDRAACAWLVQRFIDEDASFVFVDDSNETPSYTTPFDMRGAELSHHNGECLFEAFLRRYRPDDPALRWIVQLVRKADLEDELHDAPEAARLDSIVRGLSLICDDETLIASTALLRRPVRARHAARPDPPADGVNPATSWRDLLASACSRAVSAQSGTAVALAPQFNGDSLVDHF